MNLCNRIFVPDATRALLWDMDGVLVDSLSFAIQVSQRLLAERYDGTHEIASEVLQTLFPLEPPDYWKAILQHLNEKGSASIPIEEASSLSEHYMALRAATPFPVHTGIREILEALRAGSVPCAVVSNNKVSQVSRIIGNCGLGDYFVVVVGNDHDGIRKKPCPDPYLFAAKRLGLDPESCVVVEDSALGIAAGLAAGCHTIGVATGSASTSGLEEAGAHQVYSDFAENSCKLVLGDVRNKRIGTPNQFVSHMLEHIAWRLGTAIYLHWNNNDYRAAGEFLGHVLRAWPAKARSGACLGMIDDGSAEVLVDLDAPDKRLDLGAEGDVSLPWFLSLRCEQLPDGKPLEALLRGLSDGLGAGLRVRICSAEDPHHTWEGVFRALGIALARIYTPDQEGGSQSPEANERETVVGDIAVRTMGIDYCEVRRKTAESELIARIDFSRGIPNAFEFHVDPSIGTAGVDELLGLFADKAGFSLQVSFKASVLSSSHVLFEDTALVIGRGLLELLVLRMNSTGAEGAGSNIRSREDIENAAIGVGLSVEGRKFWSFVPFSGSYADLRRDLLIGQDVLGGIRSEDLDDFIDGLAGGLCASIMIHVRRELPAQEAWPQLMAGLGTALAEAFLPNPFRRGVPPGVKATLS